jgi:hypothetical protein
LEIETELEAKIDKKMIKEFEIYPCLGCCNYYWQVKKRLLKWDYGIKWKSPKELNPNVRYD